MLEFNFTDDWPLLMTVVFQPCTPCSCYSFFHLLWPQPLSCSRPFSHTNTMTEKTSGNEVYLRGICYRQRSWPLRVPHSIRYSLFQLLPLSYQQPSAKGAWRWCTEEGVLRRSHPVVYSTSEMFFRSPFFSARAMLRTCIRVMVLYFRIK